MLPLDQLIRKFDHSAFKLDLSGVVGLLGGNNAADAIETIHLHAGRRWAGWYNYPGSVTVAKRFGQIATLGLWESLFPAQNRSPEIVFNLAGKHGPRYCASISGTNLDETKYLGYLIAQECAKRPENDFFSGGRTTGTPGKVTVISLSPPRDEGSSQAKTRTIPMNPKHYRLALFSLVPSLASIVACVFCIIGQDFLCFSLILLGTVSSGVSSIALGAATLKILVPVPAKSSPPGDGLLLPTDGSIIVLKGREADVNIVTKGEFVLDYSGQLLSSSNHHMIGVTSVLLVAQSLVQLLLIPFSTLFGQILYLSSFIASGMYHLYVVSQDREKVQRELLLENFRLQINKQKLGTRTQMAVFVCLVLGDGDRHTHPSYKPEEVFKSIISNDTPVWRCVRRKVVNELALFWKRESSSPYEPSIGDDRDSEGMTDEDKQLLKVLIGDAYWVFRKYPEWREVWQERDNYPEEKAQDSYYSRV